MAELLLRGKKIQDLKLAEIKEELGKRQQSRKGNKPVLVKRLEKALLQEKLSQVSPDEYSSQISPTDVSSAHEEASPISGQHTRDESHTGVHVCVISPKLNDEDLYLSGKDTGTASLVEPHMQVDSSADDSFYLKGWSSEDTFDNAVNSILHSDKFVNKESSAAEMVAMSQGLSTRKKMESNNTSSAKRKIVRMTHIKDEIKEPIEDNTKFTPVIDTVEEDNQVGEIDLDDSQGEGYVADFSMDLDEQESNTEAEDDAIQGDISEVTTSQDSIKRLESIASNIEPSYAREEELIYEGDLENESIEGDKEMEDEDKDVLVLSVNAKDLDLDHDSAIIKEDMPFQNNLSSSNSSAPVVTTTTTTSAVSKNQSDNSSKNNIWVSGLAANVSAADLKTLFSPFGQVVSVKVVARARSKNERFGFIIMGTPDQCVKAVQTLNGTELKGKVITVEVPKSTPFVGKCIQKTDAKPKVEPDKTISTPNAVKATPTNNTSNNTGTPKTSKSPANNEKDVKGSKQNSRQNNTTTKSTPDSGGSGKTTGRRTDRQDSGNKGRRRSGSGGAKRIVSVESRDGKKELYTTRRREERRVRSRSPHRDRGRRLSPRGRIVSRRLSPPPPIPAPPPPPPSMRRELMRMESRGVHHRLGGRLMDSHDIEIRLQEERQRMLSEREREREREREALRREFHIEQTRKEQELLRQLQELRERENHERDLYERQQRELEQLQRSFRDRQSQLEAKERELKAKETRERERREKEIRDREKQIRDQFERNLKEKELREQRERKALEEQLRQQQKMIMEKEQKLKDEQEKLAKIKDEMGRRQKEEEERKDRERRVQDEKEQGKRETNERATKRQYVDDYPPIANISKRPAIDDSSVFGRLGGRDGRAGTSGGASNGGTPAQPSSRSSSGIVKETHISPNVTYRRYESSKSSSNRPVSNPYSQSQSRSKALEALTTNYTAQEAPPDPVSYPQPVRYSTGSLGQYRSDSSSVGYGNLPASLNPYASQQVAAAAVSNLFSSKEFLTQAAQVLSQATHGGMGQSSSPSLPPGYNQISPYSGASRLSSGSANIYPQVRSGSYHTSSQTPSMGSRHNFGASVISDNSSSPFLKPQSKGANSDGYSRRIPPHMTMRGGGPPYNKRM